MTSAVPTYHSYAMNGAEGSCYAGKATAGIELCDHGRRGDDLVGGRSVAANLAFAGAAFAGRRQRQCRIATAPAHREGGGGNRRQVRAPVAGDRRRATDAGAGRDPLEGLICGTQIGPHDFAPSPQPDQQIPSR